MSKRKNMTRADFDQARALFDIKLSVKQVATLLKISGGTAARLKHAQTWDEYLKLKERMAAQLRQRQGKKPVEVEAETKPVLKDRYEAQLEQFQNRVTNQLIVMTQVLENIENLLREKNSPKGNGVKKEEGYQIRF